MFEGFFTLQSVISCLFRINRIFCAGIIVAVAEIIVAVAEIIVAVAEIIVAVTEIIVAVTEIIVAVAKALSGNKHYNKMKDSAGNCPDTKLFCIFARLNTWSY
jgi:hypothetical protein